jgi:hypothetical protein
VINLSNPGVSPVDGDRVRVEHSNGAAVEFYYRAVDDTPATYLHMSFPESVTVGQTINMTAVVKFASGKLAPVNSVYDVPIIRESDGLQVDYLEIDFNKENPWEWIRKAQDKLLKLDIGVLINVAGAGLIVTTSVALSLSIPLTV